MRSRRDGRLWIRHPCRVLAQYMSPWAFYAKVQLMQKYCELKFITTSDDGFRRKAFK